MRKLVWALFAVLCLATALPAWANTREVLPTGTAIDIQSVRAAIASAQPGDVILLRAGTFDWSGNSVAMPPFVIPFGLPIDVSGITITGEIAPNGELLTSLVGPVDGNGLPQLYPGPFVTNAAFVNAPGVTGVTIQNLILRNFEQAIGLIQTRDMNLANVFVPGGDFSAGADDFVIQNCQIANSRIGVSGLGANDRLIVRNNSIQIVTTGGLFLSVGGLISNATAIGNLSQAPQVADAPSDLVIENNVLSGPGPDLDVLRRPNNTTVSLFTLGIGVQGASGARIEGNTIEGFSRGIAVAAEGAVRITRNAVTHCQNGLALLDRSNSSIPAGGTAGALIRNNRFTRTVFRAPRADATPNLTASGSGIVVDADNNRFVGNNIELNEVAGISLVGDATTRPDRTATGNLILGNNNVVVGSDYVLTNNTISGSNRSLLNVGQGVGRLLDEIGPPVFQ